MSNVGKSVTAKYTRVAELLAGHEELASRYAAVADFARTIRASEYHLTNACNIRCKGCWFFAHDFDTKTKDNRDPAALTAFLHRERARGINQALLIGGEPTLFPERIAQFVEVMPQVQISTNGLRPLPREGFERTGVFISLFGGGKLDDELRAYRPSGRAFHGLFDTTLENYYQDDRATFLYAVTELGIGYIEDTVRRIEDNGNLVTFNFYSQYDKSDPLRMDNEQRLIDEALRVRALFPKTVLSTEYYIRTIVTGRSHWGSFGYETCPSISSSHPAHAERLRNGNRALPLFNAYAPDLETVNFCCTSGHCEDCRDSQAVNSWMMVSLDKFLESREMLETWIALSEAYWHQFPWYPRRPTRVMKPITKAAERAHVRLPLHEETG